MPEEHFTTNFSLRTLRTSSSCKVFSSFSLVRSIFLFFIPLILLFTFLVIRRLNVSMLLVSSAPDESFSLSFSQCLYFQKTSFYFFSFFQPIFCFFSWSLIQENQFFSKEDMTFRSSVILKFNFFSIFFAYVAKARWKKTR